VKKITLRLLSISFALAAFSNFVIAQKTPASPSPDQVWKELSAGNQRFVGGKAEPRNLVSRRKELANTQNPLVAVLSCSDSRVPPELVFDEGLGDLFVVRSAGESADALALGSLEYAVKHLGSTMIVVIGHESCGAVKAACSGGKTESPNLAAVVAPIAPSCSVSKDLDVAVRDHVHRVAQDLLTKSAILKQAVTEGKLTIVEAYYSLDTGAVTKLK
jgi:carbonic anhydrase